jgi:hypothetical protein
VTEHDNLYYANRSAFGSVKNFSPIDGEEARPASGPALRSEPGSEALFMPRLAVQRALCLLDVRRWAKDAGFHEAGVVALPHAQEAP